MRARAAGLAGDSDRSARLYALLAQADPANRTATRRAISQAIAGANFQLALRLARTVPSGDLAADARLLLVAAALRDGRRDEAVALLRRDGVDSDLSFLAPIVAAWSAAESRKGDPLAELGGMSVAGPAAAYFPEQQALLLIRLGRPAEARPHAERAARIAGARDARVRVTLAAAFARAGDRAMAERLLVGRDSAIALARQRLQRGRGPGPTIDSAAEAFARLLQAMAVDLNRTDGRGLPIALARIASFASPKDPSTAIVLGLLLDSGDRPDAALAAFRSVPEKSVLIGDARDGMVRTLLRARRTDAALALASQAARQRDSTADDWARLGDVLNELKRFVEAAEAYGRAAALVAAGGPGSEQWTLQLLRGGAYEQAGLWPQAREALRTAYALAPKQPLVLNYLGYAQLERGENLAEAERLIVEASALAPDDASITDSLGWAQFKTGQVAKAIATLQRAAQKDPGQAEIHEHLGDALYVAGRKFEARFAWQAALVTADETVARRIRAKIDSGLTPATAAP